MLMIFATERVHEMQTHKQPPLSNSGPHSVIYGSVNNLEPERD